MHVKSLKILAEYLFLMELFLIYFLEFQMFRFFIKFPLNVISVTSKTHLNKHAIKINCGYKIFNRLKTRKNHLEFIDCLFIT